MPTGPNKYAARFSATIRKLTRGNPAAYASGSRQSPRYSKSLSTRHLVILLLSLANAGCAGYRFGAATLYPPDIHTVYVPVFESDSFRRGLGERLTEAVVKAIEARTPYKVVGSAEADSVLTGKIILAIANACSWKTPTTSRAKPRCR